MKDTNAVAAQVAKLEQFLVDKPELRIHEGVEVNFHGEVRAALSVLKGEEFTPANDFEGSALRTAKDWLDDTNPEQEDVSDWLERL